MRATVLVRGAGAGGRDGGAAGGDCGEARKVCQLASCYATLQASAEFAREFSTALNKQPAPIFAPVLAHSSPLCTAGQFGATLCLCNLLKHWERRGLGGDQMCDGGLAGHAFAGEESLAS
jgi:hypothetical protein